MSGCGREPALQQITCRTLDEIERTGQAPRPERLLPLGRGVRLLGS